MKTYFDFMITRLKLRLLFLPAVFICWHLLNPKTYSVTEAIADSILSSIVFILAVIVIDYTINEATAEKLHVPVEKIYQARYEIRWDTNKILSHGASFEHALRAEIQKQAMAKLKKEAK